MTPVRSKRARTYELSPPSPPATRRKLDNSHSRSTNMTGAALISTESYYPSSSSSSLSSEGSLTVADSDVLDSSQQSSPDYDSDRIVLRTPSTAANRNVTLRVGSSKNPAAIPIRRESLSPSPSPETLGPAKLSSWIYEDGYVEYRETTPTLEEQRAHGLIYNAAIHNVDDAATHDVDDAVTDDDAEQAASSPTESVTEAESVGSMGSNIVDLTGEYIPQDVYIFDDSPEWQLTEPEPEAVDAWPYPAAKELRKRRLEAAEIKARDGSYGKRAGEGMFERMIDIAAEAPGVEFEKIWGEWVGAIHKHYMPNTLVEAFIHTPISSVPPPYPKCNTSKTSTRIVTSQRPLKRHSLPVTLEEKERQQRELERKADRERREMRDHYMMAQKGPVTPWSQAQPTRYDR